MQVAKTLAGKAKQAGNVHVHAEMREGMLSSEFFLCIEVEIDLEAATSPWTVVRASQGARALFDFAPWGDLMLVDATPQERPVVESIDEVLEVLPAVNGTYSL